MRTGAAGYDSGRRCLARDPARLDGAVFRGQGKVVEGDLVGAAPVP
ncbi:MAG: hypothetical protein ACRDTE_07015 [Pseudonocardiaceae bacterium]